VSSLDSATCVRARARALMLARHDRSEIHPGRIITSALVASDRLDSESLLRAEGQSEKQIGKRWGTPPPPPLAIAYQAGDRREIPAICGVASLARFESSNGRLADRASIIFH